MTAKTLEGTLVRPAMKKKLNGGQKTRLCNLAARKFIDLDLRAAQATALDKLIEQIRKDAESIDPAEIAVLRKYGQAMKITKLELPYSMKVTVGTKKFEVGDKIVERPETETISRILPPREGDLAFPSIDGVRTWLHNIDYFGPGNNDTLPVYEAFYVPGYGGHHFGDSLKLHDDINGGMLCYRNQTVGFTFSAETQKACEAYFIAAHERLVAERKVIGAMCKFILAANYWSQIVEFWPEAEEIVDDLFPTEVAVSAALVPVSDEDKALLCNAMSRRGVASAYCLTKTSPAYAEAGLTADNMGAAVVNKLSQEAA